MMHMPIRPAQLEPRARYGERRFSGYALAMTALVHAALGGALLAFGAPKFAAERETRLVVQMIKLEQPPPPSPSKSDSPVKPAPPSVHVPPPLLTLPAPRPPKVAVSLEPPPPTPQPTHTAPEVTPAAPAPAPAAPVARDDLSSSMIHAPPPRYPHESRRKREQGTVVLAVTLGTDGSVEDIRIARSSGYSRLDDAALGAVRKWRWSPTLSGGVAVRVRGTVEIPFVLREA